MKVNEVLKKHGFIPRKYRNSKTINIITTDKGILVYKNKKINEEVFNYLRSRNFGYLPKLISNIDDDYVLYNYIEDFDIPKEQKILDMINLVALLHSKTTVYKEIDSLEYDKLYEQIDNNIKYLYGYYTDLITLIESKVYMSPDEYMLARNISIIYDMIDASKKRLDNWYKLVSNKEKTRTVLLHGNLCLDHFIRNHNSYLISWDKAKIGMPVFDLYKLYKNHNELDFSEILYNYEKNYPLTLEEKELLFLLMGVPDVIKIGSNHYENTRQINNLVSKLYMVNDLPKKLEARKKSQTSKQKN